MASRCADGGLLFCDGFESDTVGQAPAPATWTPDVLSTATVNVDGAITARGLKALKVHNDKVLNNKATIRVTRPFPLQKFWMRAFFYMDVAPSAPASCSDNGHIVHWVVASVTGSTTTTKTSTPFFPEMRFVAFINDTWIVNEGGTDNGEQGQADFDTPPGQAALPSKTWVCYEAYFDAPGKEVRVFWDGMEHPGLHVQNGQSAGNGAFEFPDDHYDSLTLGLKNYQDCSPVAGVDGFDVWFDEVAIDTNRIGCSR